MSDPIEIGDYCQYNEYDGAVVGFDLNEGYVDIEIVSDDEWNEDVVRVVYIARDWQ